MPDDAPPPPPVGGANAIMAPLVAALPSPPRRGGLSLVAAVPPPPIVGGRTFPLPPVVLRVLPLRGSPAPVGFIYDETPDPVDGELLAAASAFFSHQGHQVYHDPCPDLAEYCRASGVPVASVVPVDRAFSNTGTNITTYCVVVKYANTICFTRVVKNPPAQNSEIHANGYFST